MSKKIYMDAVFFRAKKGKKAPRLGGSAASVTADAMRSATAVPCRRHLLRSWRSSSLGKHQESQRESVTINII